jgi:guanidinoacetate N-methyltransferase
MDKFKKLKLTGCLSQIPKWECNDVRQGKAVIDYKRGDWQQAPAVFSEHRLEILGQAVMEDWETPLMERLAAIASMNGGTVLEVGFGMGISARFIQSHPIERHIIIEANKDVARRAREFGLSAEHPVDVLEGLWENVIENVTDESVDGILFDSYPLSDDELYQNHFPFFSFAFRKLRGGGTFTYYSDEVRTFSRSHMARLLAAGFNREQITGQIVRVAPPSGCEYWKAKTILAPIIIK